jgi:non-specific serine/threonine protein kinase
MEPRTAQHQTPNNLGLQPTRLIGREHELEEISRTLLRSDLRLLTLTGPGGTGKTRLAIACAERLLRHFPDGVYFVDLAPLRDPSFVLSEIARALQVPEPSSGGLSDALLRLLHDKFLLLVLDNFEHVRAAAPDVSTLLGGAAGLKALVTSRTPLHVRWEHEVPIPPLTLPELHSTPDAASLARSPAVALFVERARAVRPDFAVTSGNARALAEICIRLDGLPLALELAAARIKALAAGDLLALLERRLEPFGVGASDAVPRQRTLRATMMWSHDLLGPPERTLFRRLAIFAGGWSADAAQAVCAGGDVTATDVVDLLSRLVDQSLVQMEEVDGKSRFRLLETVRQFGHDLLESSGDIDWLRRQHATYFLGVAETLGPEPRVFGPEASSVRAELERERDNMRAALRWFIEQEEPEFALRMADALQSFWYVRGPYIETRRVLQQVLAMPGASPPTVLRASLLNGAAIAAFMNGDAASARDLNEQALAIARAKNDLFVAGRALQSLANAFDLQGHSLEARNLAEEALSLYRRVGSQFREAAVLTNLSRYSRKLGDIDAARTLAEQALTIARSLASGWLISSALLGLANALRDQGKLEPARTVLKEAVALSSRDRDRRELAFCLDVLGQVALVQGRPSEAHTQLLESLRLCWELGEQARVADVLETLSQLVAVGGQRHEALRLAGAATALREKLRVAAPSRTRTFQQPWMDQARKALGEESVAAFLSEGQAMTTDEAVRDALNIELGSSSATEMDSRSPLTRREAQVARLVARGMGNRAIADELVITEGTVEVHVKRILSKLGFRSRSQVAVWAAQHLSAPLEQVPAQPK